uniref:beta-galactosidase n=1 Tax=uncultured Sphingomonas sp. TaxID=158754 RepID=UPI0035C96F34
MKRLLVLLLACAATPALAQGPAPKAASERLWLGSAWYPEQWPEERWDEDLRLMHAHGANVVRIGEYAWSRIEREEGQYDLAWLQRAVRLAAKYDIKVVIGTPTDTPPAWLTQKYPDTLRIDTNNVQAGHGGRRQFSISSPRYRAMARDVVARMADAVGNEPNVIGWQIGNEHTEESYDPAARDAWHGWLKAKYGTLDRMNDVWATAYWSQTYTAWDQVPFSAAAGNPGWMLDLKHFITEQWVAFQANQADVVRAKVPAREFITTNLGGLGWANRFDRYAINRGLDLASWDDYVGTGHLDAYRNGAVNDLARGWKRQNFWVMETQPGFVNWAPVSNMLYPGETRALAWQTVGHGADAVLFWQWRNALNGQETMHGSLVGPDGKPLPIYAEATQIGADFAKASAALAGTSPDAKVAILQDYDSRWAIDFQPLTRDYDQIGVLLDYYRPLKDALGAVDVVSAGAPLDRYKLVVAPSLNVIPGALAKRLADYVRKGGHLILGPRSGLKDEFNRLDTTRQPGPLAPLLGARVEQFYALDEPVAVEGGTASIWAEDLTKQAPDATVLLRYGKANGWLDGHPAAITRSVGKGRISYYGALFDKAVTQRLLDAALADAKITRDFAVPADVELMTREGQGRHIVILVNHGRTPQHVALPATMTDILGGGITAAVDLAPEGVAVLQRPTTGAK